MLLTIITLFMLSSLNVLHGQSVEIKAIINEIYCDFANNSVKEIYINEEKNDSVFIYNSLDSSCIDLIVYADRNEIIKILKKKKKLYIISISENNTPPIVANEKCYTFTMYEITKKGYKKKKRMLIYNGDFLVFLKRNSNTSHWEFKELKYTGRLEIRNKK